LSGITPEKERVSDAMKPRILVASSALQVEPNSQFAPLPRLFLIRQRVPRRTPMDPDDKASGWFDGVKTHRQ
jgi:hypothetical protein